MNAIDLLVNQLTSSADMLKMTLADMTDAELIQRPVAGANHPLWQLGHLCGSEAFFVNQIRPGAMPELPAGFADRFSKKSVGIDDSAHFVASKQELIELFTKLRSATIAVTKTLKQEDLGKQSPEAIRGFCPTVGDTLSILASHVIMHLGQIQVLRRKLGKPILF